MAERYSEELFLGYVEGDLPPQQRALFERVLAEDPQLRTLVAQVKLDREELRAMPDAPPPAALLEMVHQRLERDMLLQPRAVELSGSQRRRQHARTMRLVAYSGVAALVLLSAGLMLYTL